MDQLHFTETIGTRNGTNMNNTTFENLSNGTGPNTPLGPFAGGMPPVEENTLAHSIIHQVVVPAVAVLGILGNGPSLVILCRSKSSQSFLKYLTALTTIDLLLLLAALLRSLAEIIHRNVKPISFVKALSDLYLGIMAGSCLQRLSATFITVISLERFLAVVHPWYYRRSILRRKPTSTVVTMVTIHLLLQVPSLITSRVGSSPIPGSDGYRVVPALSMQVTGIIRQIDIFLNLLVGNVVPLVIVLIATAAVVIRLKKSGTLNKSKGGANRGDVMERESMALVLIGIATAFAICTTTTTVMFALPVVLPPFYKFELIQIMMNVAHVVICLNSACNFAFYILASKSFRGIILNRLNIRCNQKGEDPPVADGNANGTDRRDSTQQCSSTKKITTAADGQV